MNAHVTAHQIAVITPFFNEAENVVPFVTRLKAVLDGAALDWKLICVNDGSSDETLARLIACRAGDARIAIIDLSRNFGKEFAITAGLDHADAPVVVLLDADLQHPPEAIPAMIAKWREGFDVVYMVRRQRADVGPITRFARSLYYLAFGLVCDVALPPGAGDFRLMDACVVDAIREMPEQTRFMKGIYHWVGFRQTGLPYDEAPRSKGSSKWNFWRLTRLAVDSISAFSNMPLKLWSALGALIAGASLIYAVCRVIRTFLYGVDVPGFESMIVAISFLGGLQLLSLGVLGSYIGRIFDEVKGRPLYIVRRVYGSSSVSRPATRQRKSGAKAIAAKAPIQMGAR